MDNKPKEPIGITLPIRGGNSGYFEQSFDTVTQVRSNIYNLLNTRPGERRMQPIFGSRLHSLVFEQNIEILPEIASNIIKEDIAQWIPNVTVINVTPTLLKNEERQDDINIYRLSIKVDFMLNLTKQKDTVTVVIDTTR